MKTAKYHRIEAIFFHPFGLVDANATLGAIYEILARAGKMVFHQKAVSAYAAGFTPAKISACKVNCRQELVFKVQKGRS